MAIRTKAEILEEINTILGENTNDNAIALIENISDTFDDYDSKVEDKTNWKEKYEENDRNWKKKYKDRFMSGKPDENEDELINNGGENKPLKFENLFKEE